MLTAVVQHVRNRDILRVRNHPGIGAGVVTLHSNHIQGVQPCEKITCVHVAPLSNDAFIIDLK